MGVGSVAKLTTRATGHESDRPASTQKRGATGASLRLRSQATIVHRVGDFEGARSNAGHGMIVGSKSARSQCESIQGMRRSFLLIAMGSLSASLSIGCYAQEPATIDTSQMSREEWQAHVKAARERLRLMRRERKSLVAPPPTEDEIVEAASKRVLEDDLRPGDIVSTKAGLFRFRGSSNRERRPEDFERLR